MAIEELACSEVDRVFSRCQGVKTIIRSSDSTPFTDGHIDLYKNDALKAEDHIGRVQVQVKGRTIKTGGLGRPSFRVRVVDLRAYLDGGCLYFVVDVAADDRNVDRAWYVLLSPFEVRRKLEAVKEGQKDVVVELQLLPSHCKSLLSLLRLAIQSRTQP